MTADKQKLGGWANPLQPLPQGLVLTFDVDIDVDVDPDPDPELDNKWKGDTGSYIHSL